MPDLFIGGSGIFGLTIAERAAAAGYDVTVVEQRDHIGGNCSSHIDPETGVEVHTYGSHIFHTNNEKVWEYVNRFSKWIPYTHRVRTSSGGKVIPLPFGLATFSAVHDKIYTPDTLRNYIESLPPATGESLEEVALASVGPEVYEAVIRGYTIKQWGRDPKDLPAATIKRIPVRYNWDDRYFTDKYQALPVDGYQAWIDRMASNPRITVELSQNALDSRYEGTPMVYTGPIDAYFGYRYGNLGWRLVEFHEYYPRTDDFQGCPVMNNGNDQIPWTRIHEYKHYRPDRETKGTVIHSEFSREARVGEIGAYPVDTAQDREILRQYRYAADQLEGVWFGGRLGTYKYLDMHMAIASALVMWQDKIRPYLESA